MVNIFFKASGIKDYDKIKKFINKDCVIVYPTDTVYGVGARIQSETAIKKIYEAKSRAFSSPLIALVSTKEKVWEIAKINPDTESKVEILMEKFWPGGLTIILEKKENVPSLMVSGGNTVGVRMPDHPVALKVIDAAGGILPTTSANISGEPTPRSFDEISAEFRDRADVLIDDGKCPVGTESTIIDMSSSNIRILRAGAITKEQIEEVIGQF